MNIPRLLLAARLASAALVVSACGPAIPSPDVCEEGTESVASLTLGEATLDTVFEPWGEDQEVSLILGSQGDDMISMRFRVEGADRDCIALRTTLENESGESLGEQELSLRFYEQDDGSLVTDTHFFVLEGPAPTGASVRMETTIGEVSASQTLTVSR